MFDSPFPMFPLIFVLRPTIINLWPLKLQQKVVGVIWIGIIALQETDWLKEWLLSWHRGCTFLWRLLLTNEYWRIEYLENSWSNVLIFPLFCSNVNRMLKHIHRNKEDKLRTFCIKPRMSAVSLLHLGFQWKLVYAGEPDKEESKCQLLLELNPFWSYSFLVNFTTDSKTLLLFKEALWICGFSPYCSTNFQCPV